jgi:hypothetical protein
MSRLPSLKSPSFPSAHSRKYSYVPELFWRLTRMISSESQPGTFTPSWDHFSVFPFSPKMSASCAFVIFASGFALFA